MSAPDAWWTIRFTKHKTHTEVTVGVRIVDARQAFGRTDYLIVPVVGDGEVWVQESSLDFPQRQERTDDEAPQLCDEPTGGSYCCAEKGHDGPHCSDEEPTDGG